MTTIQTIPITEVDRHWAQVAQQARRTHVVITRHGRPWVRLGPCSEALRATLARSHWTCPAEIAGQWFGMVARRSHAIGAILVLHRGRPSLLITPIQINYGILVS